ncbi:YciI family protein (plasmid) [Neorhizobium sp. DAR64861/K0K2]|uniref:YciI family protein n=1 Tax=Neorhizobium sp. DAR64861/K0K2 TaxID=3421956 RepID=UPI003D2BE3B3
MPYLIIAKDHLDRQDDRERIRDAHRSHLASIGKKLLASGALLADDGETIVGGASLLDTDDEEEARRFESEDPYAKAGIRAEVTIVRWRLRWWKGLFNGAGFISY